MIDDLDNTDPVGTEHAREHLGKSDTGNAELFVAQHGENVRFVPAWGKWLVWDGTRWALDDLDQVAVLGKQTVIGMMRDACAITGTSDAEMARRQTAVKSAASCHSRNKRENMVVLASKEVGVAVRPNELDVDQWLLNVSNGTVDLRTGELHPHDRKRYITKLISSSYDPTAVSTEWEAFLAQTFGGDAELVEYVQRIIGYCCTGSIREQLLFLLIGKGRNGKSTMLNVLQGMLQDYATTTKADTLLATRDDAHRVNEMARLQGVRFVSAVETDDGRRWNEAQVKQLSGGDPVTGRYMRGEPFSMRLIGKFLLASNELPRVTGGGFALFRRLVVLPFSHTVTDAQVDTELEARLLASSEAILAWVVAGAVKYYESGFGDQPAVVSAATQSYKVSQDMIGAFLAEDCETEVSQKVATKHLYSAYVEWSKANGEYIHNSRVFAAKLESLGYVKGLEGAARLTHWRGLGLKVAPPTTPF